MHVSLSDLLVCPRCGPEWGLILVPEAVVGRRVERGSLGCPNCRTQYGIRAGVAWLAAGGERVSADGGVWVEGGGVRLAALLGLGERRGTVLVAGSAAGRGAELAGLFEGVEVLVSPPAVPSGGGASGSGVSGVELGSVIPIRTGALHGVALTGGASRLLEEGARVLGPGARLLVEPATAGVREALDAAGLRVLAAEGGTVVAVR